LFILLYVGSFRVAVSLPETPLFQNGLESVGNQSITDKRELFEQFDLTEFRASVSQLLDLLTSENFCHPYGIIAGTVA